jgi:cation diffusion facilitator family transporter
MSGGCEDCDPGDLTHASKGYRRALAWVVAMNLGMGVVQLAGGLLGMSQSLKADALDFLGDGLITLLGLLLVSRSPRWRARAALLQGIFLVTLSAGVLAAAAYRAIEQQLPEASVMTVLGLVGFAVNMTAALLLIPYRKGDANVRAVWLFSRNDALGNLAVVLAAGLVYWTNSPWPDLITAAIIAGLFLTSAIEIIRTARRELQSQSPPRTDPDHVVNPPARRR